MRRMTQVEKFQAKVGKGKGDEKAIYERQKKETLSEKGAKIAHKKGMPSEDIFAIIGRDGMDTFVNMWNNSMETVIKETIREEIQPYIRQVVREELATAFSGIVRGLSGDAPEVVEEPEVEEEPTVIYLEPREEEYKFYPELRELIWKFKASGGNPLIGKMFKMESSRNNGLYQMFMRKNKGTRGAWQQFVVETLNGK